MTCVCVCVCSLSGLGWFFVVSQLLQTSAVSPRIHSRPSNTAFTSGATLDLKFFLQSLSILSCSFSLMLLPAGIYRRGASGPRRPPLPLVVQPVDAWASASGRRTASPLLFSTLPAVCPSGIWGPVILTTGVPTHCPSPTSLSVLPCSCMLGCLRGAVFAVCSSEPVSCGRPLPQWIWCLWLVHSANVRGLRAREHRLSF